MINNTTELIDLVMDNERIYFCGAGKVCEEVLSYLNGNFQRYHVSGIIVSAGQKTSDSKYGFCLLEMSDDSIDLSIPVLVTTRENLHTELLSSLKLRGFKEVYCIAEALAMKLLTEKSQRSNLSAEVIDGIVSRGNRMIPKPSLDYLILNILDHCNLNCKGCDHFACIADPYCVPLDTIVRDLECLSQIVPSQYLQRIGVMGGEPLLHPELLEILREARRLYPYTEIGLTTNALLLSKQDEDFWKTCMNSDITIQVTKYPIDLPYSKLEEKAEKENVKLIYYDGTKKSEKKLFKRLLNLSGDSDSVKQFMECSIANRCNFLMEGKLYGCPFSCQADRIFNKKFNQNLSLTEKDYLDIYKIKDLQEILDFAARPKYFCRYCMGLSEPFAWERTKSDMYEWVKAE